MRKKNVKCMKLKQAATKTKNSSAFKKVLFSSDYSPSSPVYSSGLLPSQWRTNLITPIFVSGDRSSIKNYRLISLVPIISKVLEGLIYDKIIPHVTPQLTSSQF